MCAATTAISIITDALIHGLWSRNDSICFIEVYMSMPAIYRPILQQQLDHSLALVMLTLEFYQAQGDVVTVRPASDNPWENTHESRGTLLKTQWRVTDFDFEDMRVVFQLEEKLGLEAAEQRRFEMIQQQLFLNTSSSTCCSNGLLLEPLYTVENFDTLPSSSHCPKRRREDEEEDIETRIWRARRNAIAAGRTSLDPSLRADTSLDHGLEDLPDSNFFHCNGTNAVPVLRAATVSFKGERNLPASWLLQPTDDPWSSPSINPHHKLPCLMTQEVVRAVRTQEHIAAFQQNRVLLRSLARMRSQEESRRAQFLPKAIELDTQELGLKKAEAVILKPVPLMNRDVNRRTHANKKIKGRRHSWHQLMLRRDRPSSFSSSKVLAESSKITDWSSVISNMATTMYRSSMRAMYQETHYKRPCFTVRTTPVQDNEFCMKLDPAEYGHGHLKSLDKEDTVEDQQLFEFTYGIRHNYLHSSRLEGERVIRPIRFECSLDFFVQPTL
ncbi:hypothetical protein BGX28_010129 [Mortierella sp. GBA30]|nr:hypothetical protein BGX28_010129 [Mortierella sp. GBA30]